MEHHKLVTMVPMQTAKALIALAKADERSVSYHVRQAIQAYLVRLEESG